LQAIEDESRRTTLTNFWGEQAVLLQEEADMARNELLKLKKDTYDFTLISASEEYVERDLARTHMQVEAASTSDAIDLPNSELGVFGIPLGRGEYFAIDGGFVPGLDQQDIHVLDADPHTEYEEMAFDLSDLQGDHHRSQDLYAALNQDAKYLTDSISRMIELREMHERDVKQLENEHSLVITAQTGPPRRLPDKFEISTTHTRKEQISKLRQKIAHLQHSIDVAEDKKRDKESQLLSLAQALAVQSDKIRKLENSVNSVNSINEGLGQLPIVVGRNISKIRGASGPLMKPKEYYDAVKNQSQFYVFKELEEDALKAHASRVNIDRNLWLVRQSDSELKGDLSQTLNSLSEIQERMKTSLVNSLKISLVEALDAFIHSGTKLVPRGLHYSGLLPWWKCRNSKLSANVISYSGGNALGGVTFEDAVEEEESEINKTGVSLGAANRGECYGIIKLPKMALWNIVVSVCRSKPTDGAIPDEHDYCAIRFGPSFASLQLIDHYFNRINPETGAVLYDVKFLLRGDKLAYKFEFSSSSSDQEGHLAICTGFYEEYQMQALEFFSDPKNPHARERVLSSYVKIMRVDEVQGKNRLTKLLEELISVEEFDGLTWDSLIMQNTPQRYEKDFFLRILKAEILSELYKAQSLGIAQADQVTENLDENAEDEDSKKQRLKQSEELFLMRKRDSQQWRIEKARLVVGKFIEVYDENTDSWFMCYVKDIKVDWVDNGLTAKITHELEEVNKGGEILNTLEFDLNTRRYFESAQQEFTDEGVQRWKQNRTWQARLKELTEMQQDAQKKYKEAFQNIKSQALSNLEAEITATYDSFDQKSTDEATNKLEDERTVQWISNRIPDIIIEMRKGVIDRDMDLLPRDQAAAIAKGRFIAQYKIAKKNALDKNAITRRQKMQMRLAQKLEEFKKAENDYIKQINSEKFTIEYHIREQQELERQEALKKLKFDPDVFRRVVPTSDQCEHLKSKAWGDSYGKGIRCVNCGKELTDLYKEESQLLGFGSGCDRNLYLAINRHRKDEASFKESQPGERMKVERERLRLEKERREMEESEVYFYDFADLKCIYDFDQRHSSHFKKIGKFRQGVQWTEDELILYEEKKIEEQKVMLTVQNRSLETLKDFDPLSEVEEPPPTFRGFDERRKAQFDQTIFNIGRLHNFQKKIAVLKDARVEYLAELALFKSVLTSLHKDSFTLDIDLDNLEADMDRTFKLLSTYDLMEKLWAQAQRIERQAIKDKKKAEMRHCGLWANVKEQIDVTTFLREETRALLKLKLLYEQKYQDAIKAIGDTRVIATNKYTSFLESEFDLYTLQYCKPGSHVQTRYGLGKVCVFRPKDKMLMVILSFGRPFAKLWILADEVIRAERARQQGERLLMDIEDNRTKRLVSSEKISIRRELYLMRKEEVGMKEYWHFVDFMNHEDQLVTKGLQESVVKTYALIDTKKFTAIMDDASSKVIERKIKMNKEAIKNFKGPRAARPKKLTSVEILKIKKDLELDLKQKFLAKVKLLHCLILFCFNSLFF
jgi:hypothetical protein